MIESCYMDEQPAIGITEVKDKEGIVIAEIMPITMAVIYANIKKLDENNSLPFEALVPALVKRWASKKPITYENLLTLPTEYQNAISTAVIKSTVNAEGGYAKNSEQPSSPSLTHNQTTESLEKSQ